MSKNLDPWEIERALFQALDDLLRLNDADRQMISTAEKRMRGRTHLRKMLLRRFDRQGLVNLGDAYDQRWVRRDSLPKPAASPTTPAATEETSE